MLKEKNYVFGGNLKLFLNGNILGALTIPENEFSKDYVTETKEIHKPDLLNSMKQSA